MSRELPCNNSYYKLSTQRKLLRNTINSWTNFLSEPGVELVLSAWQADALPLCYRGRAISFCTSWQSWTCLTSVLSLCWSFVAYCPFVFFSINSQHVYYENGESKHYPNKTVVLQRNLSLLLTLQLSLSFPLVLIRLLNQLIALPRIYLNVLWHANPFQN